MTADRFTRLKQILFGALEHPTEERTAFLEQECGEDATLLEEARTKLARLETEPGILRSTGVGAFLGDEVPSTPPPPRQTDDTIGPYRILDTLGEGGMGIVYEAEQQSPRRRVALKVVRGGRFVSETSVRMFQREAETLARLEHPNIGAIYESGRTEDGQHFFAMEIVRGVTLDENLATRTSGSGLAPAEVRRRLRLFAGIAQAVHYAHQRGVIHRDLKPSNIVVVERDSEQASTMGDLPEFKILDFGLARITDSDVAASMVSEVGVIKGTLSYMSPEQARGNPDEIDVRTDVYSLGVILYEMLTGHLPQELASGSIPEALRMIIEEPPRPLSETFRGTKQLDPDVQTICAKALAKDPADRYGSAAELAEDVRRYLTSQPIVARPPSTIYQIRKFAARNKAVVAGAIATMTVLILGIITSTTLAIREAAQKRVADAARIEAERETERATEVQKFLEDMLTTADPYLAKGPQITMAEVLESASEKIEGRFPDRPDIAGTIRFTIGRTSVAVNDWEKAWRHLREALPALREAYPDDHPLVADCLRFLGEVACRFGEPEAVPWLEESVAMFTSLNGESDSTTAVAKHDLAFAVGRFPPSPEQRDSALARSEELYLEAGAVFRRMYGEHHQGYARWLQAYSVTVWFQGRREEAVDMIAQGIEIVEQLEGQDHFLQPLYADRAFMMSMLGNQEEAERCLQESRAAAQRAFGTGSIQDAWETHGLGEHHLDLEQYEDALKYLSEAAAIKERLLDPDDGDLAKTMELMMRAYAGIGDEGRGREVGRKTVPLLVALADANPDDDVAQFRAARAALEAWPPELRDPVTAERFALRLSELNEHRNPSPWKLLAEAQMAQGKRAEAVESIEKALQLVPEEDEEKREELQELLRRARRLGG